MEPTVSTITDASAGSGACVSTHWTAVQKAESKRIVPPPSSDDYSTWTVDQLKLECTARKLSVAKNTNKADRVTILQGYDESQNAMELLLDRQRQAKRGRGAYEETTQRRNKHCLYRLLNVLFSEDFFEKFITSGDALTRRELDEGGREFWEQVAEAFSTINDDFDRLVSSDSLFEGIEPQLITARSGAKLKSMWKECNARFAAAEGRCKLSGSHDEFWQFCQGDKVAMYVHLWCEERGSGREFCATCVYQDNEDDESKEREPSEKKQKVNRKRLKQDNRRNSIDSVSILTEAVNKLVETDLSRAKGALIEEKIGVARRQREKLERDALVEKLAAVDGILARRRQALHDLDIRIYENGLKGLDVADLKRERESTFRRVQTAQEKSDELQDLIMGD